MKSKNVRKQKPKLDEQPYSPNEALVRYLTERLQLMKKRTTLKESGKEMSDEDQNKFDASDRMKVYIRDKIIFPSMANLVYFLETVVVNPALKELFEDDLKDLFDLRPPNKTRQLYPYYGIELRGIRIQETTFTRLIAASLAMNEDKHFEDFRLDLLHTLQSIVYGRMWYMMHRRYGWDSQITKSALRDLENSLGWTGLIKEWYKSEEIEIPKVLGFPAPYSK